MNNCKIKLVICRHNRLTDFHDRFILSSDRVLIGRERTVNLKRRMEGKTSPFYIIETKCGVSRKLNKKDCFFKQSFFILLLGLFLCLCPVSRFLFSLFIGFLKEISLRFKRRFIVIFPYIQAVRHLNSCLHII